MHGDPTGGQGEGQLHAGLKQRHMTMISLGGVKMWLYPFLTYLSIAGIVGVLVLMLFDDDARSQLLFSLVSVAVVLVAYFVQRGRGKVPETSGVAAEGGTA